MGLQTITQYLPSWVAPTPAFCQLVTGMVVILVMLHVILIGCAYGIMLERKLSAWMQDRVGPNRVGPFGLLQPIADGLKFILKEEFTPKGAEKALFMIAPALIMIPAMFSFLGGMRASAQMISYEIPMGLALLCVVLSAGTLDPYAIVEAQSHGKGMWNIVQQPVAAVLFYVCMLAESNRAPFDLAEAESELVGGYHTEYSSMRFAMFFLAEYFHMITGAAFFSLLFLGGWSLNPFGGTTDLPMQGGPLLILAQWGVMLGKVTFMVAFAMAIRWTLPRFRFDQLMRLAWEGMIPTSLVMLLITATFAYMGWTAHIWIGSLLCIAAVYLLGPMLPRQANPNHRIGIIGSRFSPLVEGAGTVSRHPVALDDSAIPDRRQGPLSMH